MNDKITNEMKRFLNYLVKVFTWKTYASELQTKLNKQHARSFGWYVLNGHEYIGETRGELPLKDMQSLIKRWAVKL